MPCQYSLLYTAPEVQPPDRACLGCPETLVSSSVTLPTSKETVGLAQLPWAASTPTKPVAGNLRRALSRDLAARAGSDILIHAPPKHPHASPAAPACGPVIRVPEDVVQVWTRYQNSALAVRQPVRHNHTVAVCEGHERPWPHSIPYHPLGFTINPARSCQTREFGNAKRLGGQSKACSEAPMSLKRPGKQGSRPSRKPC